MIMTWFTPETLDKDALIHATMAVEVAYVKRYSTGQTLEHTPLHVKYSLGGDPTIFPNFHVDAIKKMKWEQRGMKKGIRNVNVVKSTLETTLLSGSHNMI